MKARLIVADSEHNADLLYAVGMFVPDPFIYLEVRGRRYAVMSDLEIDRARRLARVDRVLSYATYQRRLRRETGRTPRLVDVVRAVLRELRVRSVEVPSSFPLGLARQLRGVRVRPAPDPFYPERETKSAREIRHLGAAQRLAEHGLAAGVAVLRRSRVGRDGYLYAGGNKLTAAAVRGAINAAIARAGGVAPQTIVAGGDQGCDPHETGHGPLRARRTIILDVFPRDTTTGYWGDITRTVVRGRASEAVRRLYATVQRAQEQVLGELRAGADGGQIHRGVQQLFAVAGYRTRRRNGRLQGFFHGTGHGVGLEIHEPPRISTVAGALKAGQVVTVEPGLYYPGVGGVRLEDVVVVQQRGCRNLTRFPKVLEI